MAEWPWASSLWPGPSVSESESECSEFPCAIVDVVVDIVVGGATRARAQIIAVAQVRRNRRLGKRDRVPPMVPRAVPTMLPRAGPVTDGHPPLAGRRRGHRAARRRRRSQEAEQLPVTPIAAAANPAEPSSNPRTMKTVNFLTIAPSIARTGLRRVTTPCPPSPAHLRSSARQVAASIPRRIACERGDKRGF